MNKGLALPEDLSPLVTHHETTEILGGVGLKITFKNGYTASIINHEYSYGGPQGLYELAVMRDGVICYDTPITDNVIGWLSPSDVIRLARDVAALPGIQSITQ